MLFISYLRWVPISSFVDLPIKHKKIKWTKIKSMVNYPSFIKKIAELIHLDIFVFPAVILPETKSNRDPLENIQKESSEFLLWGLTFRIFSNLMEAGKQRPICNATFTTNSNLIDFILHTYEFYQFQEYISNGNAKVYIIAIGAITILVSYKLISKL